MATSGLTTSKVGGRLLAQGEALKKRRPRALATAARPGKPQEQGPKKAAKRSGTRKVQGTNQRATGENQNARRRRGRVWRTTSFAMA